MGIFLYFHILLVSCVPKDWSEKTLDPIEMRYESGEAQPVPPQVHERAFQR